MSWCGNWTQEDPDNCSLWNYTSTASSANPERDDGIISNKYSKRISIVVICWIIFLLSFFGIITNIINFIVFYRQGFKETVTISLTYIAVWDLLKCVAGAMSGMYSHLGLISPLVEEYWKRITYPFLNKTSTLCGFTSLALATYVSIERCMCVVMPFKVKSILTRRITLLSLTGTSLFTFGIYSVAFFLYKVDTYYSYGFSGILPAVGHNKFAESHPEIFVYEKLMSIIFPSLCFVILCVSSAITLTYLKKSQEIHRRMNAKTSQGGENGGSVSSSTKKENQVAKTLLVVIGIYIATLFPRVVGICIPSLIEPEFYVFRKYKNMYSLVSDLVFVLDQINASINMFILVNMSTNYRAAFCSVFSCFQRGFQRKKVQSSISGAS